MLISNRNKWRTKCSWHSSFSIHKHSELSCKYTKLTMLSFAIADRGGRGGHAPRPVKISHKKDGCWRRLYRFCFLPPHLPSRWIRYCHLCIAYTVKSKIISVQRLPLREVLNLRPLVIHSDAYLTDITWQVLKDWRIFNFTFVGTYWLLDFNDLARINRVWLHKYLTKSQFYKQFQFSPVRKGW